MTYLLIEGRLVNMMALAYAEFDSDSRIVSFWMMNQPEPLTFGGTNDEGEDIGTPLWTRLRKMGSTVWNL